MSKLEQDAQRDLSGISDPNVVANLLKRYLRLLPAPILTDDLYEAFLEAARETGDGESARLSRLCSCVMKLPPLNHDILAEVLKMCSLVLQCEDKNFMGLFDLRIVPHNHFLTSSFFLLFVYRH